ncbi:MAG: endonuclease/exonuclease/phosphatase family protein [Owenweeksia sp.]
MLGICLAQPDDKVRVAFYNLENLFDPSDDTLKNDEEFTPQGQRYWSNYRYREKSHRMAKAILSIGEWDAPDIVGVAEIENRKVLEDLVQSPVLAKFDYDIIHFESPDRRGIDVGMIYRRDRFTLIASRNIPVTTPEDPGFATRDILYASGTIFSGDTIHLFYCHWPSRYGGQQQSEPKRILAALTVKKITDSILNTDPLATIIVAGDFNDEWTNYSLKDVLEARVPETNSKPKTLYNLMAAMDAAAGSHRYRGQWAYLDQVIVSNGLLNNSGVEAWEHRAFIVSHDFLLETDEKYPGSQPFRTFIGMKYHGGFSDHLPVYIDLYKEVPE